MCYILVLIKKSIMAGCTILPFILIITIEAIKASKYVVSGERLQDGIPPIRAFVDVMTILKTAVSCTY